MYTYRARAPIARLLRGSMLDKLLGRDHAVPILVHNRLLGVACLELQQHNESQRQEPCRSSAGSAYAQEHGTAHAQGQMTRVSASLYKGHNL